MRELREKLSSIEVITALDSSREMIVFLAERFAQGNPLVKAALGTIDRIPRDDSSVDAVVSSWGFPSTVSA